MVDDNFFILGLLCYCWLSFCSHESSLHRVFIWFLLIVCFWFFFRLCLFVFSFALYFCYRGSHSWFWFIGFSSYCFGIFLLFLLIYHLAFLTSKDHHFVIKLVQSFNKDSLCGFSFYSCSLKVIILYSHSQEFVNLNINDLLLVRIVIGNLSLQPLTIVPQGVYVIITPMHFLFPLVGA